MSRLGTGMFIGLAPATAGGPPIDKIDCACGVNVDHGKKMYECSKCNCWKHFSCPREKGGPPAYASEADVDDAPDALCPPCAEAQAAREAAAAQATSAAAAELAVTAARSGKTQRLAFMQVCKETCAGFALMEAAAGLFPPPAGLSAGAASASACWAPGVALTIGQMAALARAFQKVESLASVLGRVKAGLGSGEAGSGGSSSMFDPSAPGGAPGFVVGDGWTPTSVESALKPLKQICLRVMGSKITPGYDLAAKVGKLNLRQKTEAEEEADKWVQSLMAKQL